jgi:uncharacterized protein (TIGR03086 family)
MTEATNFRRASEGFVERARAIGSGQWRAATPCTEWDVRALVNHVTGEYLWVSELMAGRTVPEVGNQLDGDLLGEEPLQALMTAQRGAVAALEQPGALGATVHLSFGDTSAAEYAKQMTLDSVIHSWDLARATGGDEGLDPELVDICYVELRKTADGWRAAGVLGPETSPVDGTTQAKLLALSGR